MKTFDEHAERYADDIRRQVATMLATTGPVRGARRDGALIAFLADRRHARRAAWKRRRSAGIDRR